MPRNSTWGAVSESQLRQNPSAVAAVARDARDEALRGWRNCRCW